MTTIRKEEKTFGTHSPFSSNDSPVPLLTAWYYGRLFAEFRLLQKDLVEERADLSPARCGEIAAARLATGLSDEYQALEAEAKAHVRQVGPDGTDEVIDFYDAIQIDLDKRTLLPYRQVLQVLSGSRTLLLDEEEERERMKGEERI